MTELLGVLLAIVVVGVLAGFVIWIVGKLGVGLEVDGFLTAFIAAFVIAIVGGIIHWLIGLVWTIPGGWFGAIINLIVAAIVLMISGSFLKGLRVAGFVGAIVAAAAISVVTWIIQWLIGFIL